MRGGEGTCVGPAPAPQAGCGSEQVVPRVAALAVLVCLASFTELGRLRGARQATSLLVKNGFKIPKFFPIKKCSMHILLETGKYKKWKENSS